MVFHWDPLEVAALQISPRRCYPRRDHTAGALISHMSETSNPNMPDPNTSTPAAPESTPADEPVESFKDIFSEYEQTHSRKKEGSAQGREGTVIAVTADSIVLDIGY